MQTTTPRAAAAPARRIRIGIFPKRTPITELLRAQRWLGDLAPRSNAPLSPDDVPSWVNGTRPGLRLRSVEVLIAICLLVAAASGWLFAVR